MGFYPPKKNDTAGPIKRTQVSSSSKEYKDAYSQRKTARYDPKEDIYNMQEMPEFTVSGKDDRVKAGVESSRASFINGVSGLMSHPQKSAMKGVTGKYQYPSEALGFKKPGDWFGSAKGFGKNLANFGIDAVADPLNFVGAGVTSSMIKSTSRQGVKSGVKKSVVDIPSGVNKWVKPEHKAGKAMSNIGKYLTEKTLLKNAWKLNPKAYQRNLPENAMFRGIGEEGARDAIKSGVFRPKPAPDTKKLFTLPTGETFRFGKSFDKTYYSPDFKIADRYGENYIAQVNRESAQFNRRYGNKDWSYHTKREIPTSEGKILKKDWLQGYKQVKK